MLDLFFGSDNSENSLFYVLAVLLAIIGVVLILILVQWLVARRKEVDPGRNVRRQVVRLLLTIIVLVSIVLVLSMNPQTKESAGVLAALH